MKCFFSEMAGRCLRCCFSLNSWRWQNLFVQWNGAAEISNIQNFSLIFLVNLEDIWNDSAMVDAHWFVHMGFSFTLLWFFFWWTVITFPYNEHNFWEPYENVYLCSILICCVQSTYTLRYKHKNLVSALVITFLFCNCNRQDCKSWNCNFFINWKNVSCLIRHPI